MVALTSGNTGTHVATALALLATRERGSTIVALACDHGLQYVSTDLFA